MPVWVYNVCAIVGGTLFLCQLVMMLLGLGGDHDADAGADHDLGGDHEAGHGGGHEHGQGFGLHSLFTFRAVVVGLTLFGLTGRAAAGSEWSAALGLAVAAGSGAAGLLLMALLLRGLYRLESDDTLKIHQALGEEAVVYLGIPARNSGQGKITVEVQNRLLECRAVTDGEALPTGTRVEVVDLLDDETLKVAPLPIAPTGGTPALREESDPVTRKNATSTQRTEGREHG